MTTYCVDCDCVHSDTRKQEAWKWRCLKAPAKPGFKFVDPNYSPTPPYHLCSTVNDTGECPMFEPIRLPPEEAA